MWHRDIASNWQQPKVQRHLQSQRKAANEDKLELAKIIQIQTRCAIYFVLWNPAHWKRGTPVVQYCTCNVQGLEKKEKQREREENAAVAEEVLTFGPSPNHLSPHIHPNKTPEAKVNYILAPAKVAPVLQNIT